MATNIYILKLKNNKYYIGKTNDIEKRYLEHMSGNGSLWTQINKPIKIEKVIPNASKYDEDRYVKEYMNKYGIDNVRGGTYVTEELDEVARYSLQKELWGANDCCTQCGRKGHFVKDCKYKKDVNGEDISFQWEGNYCNNLFEDYNQQADHVIKQLRVSGYQITPIEASEEMIEAGKKAISFGAMKPKDLVKTIYKAMIS